MIAGDDIETATTGKTDSAGILFLQDSRLNKPVSVTAVKECFQPTTCVDVLPRTEALQHRLGGMCGGRLWGKLVGASWMTVRPSDMYAKPPDGNLSTAEAANEAVMANVLLDVRRMVPATQCSRIVRQPPGPTCRSGSCVELYAEAEPQSITRARVTPSTHVAAGNAVPVSVMPAVDEDTGEGETSDILTIPTLKPGQQPEVMMQPIDVLSLETDDFNADFTRTLSNQIAL